MTDNPVSMNRRHLLEHLVGVSKLAVPAITLASTMQAHAREMSRDRRSAILLWMGGGPSTIDLWDMKPGAATGGPFKTIATRSDAQICEHLPLLAKQMQHLSIVRSMNTIEADHSRGSYYMHTGFRPVSNVTHPSYGSVIAKELFHERDDLEVPPFVAVGGGSQGPGFLGMTWAPFVVNSSGRVDNIEMGVNRDRLTQRLAALGQMEKSFSRQHRGPAAEDHAVVLQKTLQMMTSINWQPSRSPRSRKPLKSDMGIANLATAACSPAGWSKRACRSSRSTLVVGITIKTSSAP